MATAARLTALLSVSLAVSLVLMSDQGGNGLVTLLGWLIVTLLAAGLVLGHRGGVTALAVGYLIRLALIEILGASAQLELWVQALVLTLAVETASMSFTLRVRPVEPLTALVRAAGTSLIAGGLVAALGVLVAGTETSGVLVRVAGVAALVLSAGWVVRTWRRSGLT